MSASSPMSSFKSLQPFTQGVLVTGFLTFIVSFFPWYGYSFKVAGFGGGSYTINAWHSYSWLAVFLVLVATIIAAIVIFAPTVIPATLPVGVSWIVAGLSVLGTLLELLRLLTLHHGDGLSIKWGGYVLAIVLIVNAACAVVSALSSGEPVPWQQGGGSATPPPPPAA